MADERFEGLQFIDTLLSEYSVVEILSGGVRPRARHGLRMGSYF